MVQSVVIQVIRCDLYSLRKGFAAEPEIQPFCEKFVPVQVMRAITGEIQTNLAIDDIERARTQIDSFVCKAQLLDQLQYLADFIRWNNGAFIVGAARISQAHIGIGELIHGQDAINIGVIDVPKCRATAGKMDLKMVHALINNQRFMDRHNMIDMPVHQTLRARL